MKEGHAPALAPKRSFPQAQHMMHLIEQGLVEGNHLTPCLVLLHLLVYLQQMLPQSGGGGKVADLHRLQLLGDLDLPAGHEPAGEVVAVGVIHQGFVRHGKQQVPELLHASSPADGLTLPIAEHEIPEAEVTKHEFRQLHGEVFRILIDIAGIQCPGCVGSLRFGGLQQDSQVRHLPAHVFDKHHPRLVIPLSLDGKLHIRDQAEHIVLVFLDDGLGLFERLRHQHLGPRPHAQQLLHLNQVFVGDDSLGLLHDLRVQQGQIAGVVADRVLHQQDHPHQADLGVLDRIDLVLDVLDHGQEYLRVPVPHEDLVQIGEPVPLLGDQGDLGVVVQQQQDGNIRIDLPDTAAQLERADLIDAHGQDHHVEGAVFQDLDRLLAEGNAGDSGGGGQIELVILPEDLLGELVLLFEDEGIVDRGDQEDLPDPELHQIVVDVIVGLVLFNQFGQPLPEGYFHHWSG